MSDKNNALQEWNEIFHREGEFYIYGAAVAANKCIKIAKETGVISKIKGCVVTSIVDNPTSLEGLPVIDIHKMNDKKINVLVTHIGFYREEICSLLQDMGFENVFLIAKHIKLLYSKDVQEINDEYMEQAKEYAKILSANKTAEELENEKKLREQITDLCQKGQPDFGAIQFYQSFERIGLNGTRPTLYRIKKYRLEKILRPEFQILDIGCNTGFIDMEIATQVESVLGIEYDATLVNIANCVKDNLNIKNASFVNEDFCNWYKSNSQKYDVIFSFAIHQWLNLSAEQYADILDDLLKQNGYICIESHSLDNGDKKYIPCLEKLISKGYNLCWDGIIKDDGLNSRKYTVLYKQ